MNNITKYRAELMGIAILLVLCYHIFVGTEVSVIPFLSSIGYCGVDIFLFLSGFGLCFGYAKCSSSIQFYKRRFTRIIPAYCVVVVIANILAASFSLLDTVVKISGIGYFMPINGMTSFDWYVPTIYLLYVAFPAVYMMVDRDLRWGGIVILLSFVPAAVKLVGIHLPVNNLTLSRLPIFAFGVVTGFIFIKDYTLSKKVLRFCVATACIGLVVMMMFVRVYSHEYLWSTMIYWIPFAFITPGLCIAIAFLLDRTPKILNKYLALLGSISLEIYLMHLLILKPYIHWVNEYNLWTRWLLGLCFVFVSIAFGYVLCQAVKLAGKLTNSLYTRFFPILL